MTALLATEGLNKHFGALHATRNVTFALEEGARHALIGPNGAGKTTLFSIISGFAAPTEGRIAYRGSDITGRPPHLLARQGIARTFQIVQPFPRMSVLENVAAAALFGGKQESVAAAMEVAREQLEFTGLTGFADRPASALTLAGRKRLELAKSMATSPKVLMLDEVNAGLNSGEIDGALKLIRQIAERGVTILIIEHLMKVVLSLAQRVLVLLDGTRVPPTASSVPLLRRGAFASAAR